MAECIENIVERNFHYNPILKSSYIEIFCGPMNSGKSLKLLQAIDFLDYTVKAKYMLFKPDIDTRDGPYIKTRFGDNILRRECKIIPSNNPETMLDYLDHYNVIGIDELQFFSKDSKLYKVLDEMRSRGIYVLGSGLDTNFRGEPFNEMPNVLAIANNIIKTYAVCEFPNCGQPAYFTQRLINGKPADYNSPLILVGDDEEGYQARCEHHHIVPGKC